MSIYGSLLQYRRLGLSGALHYVAHIRYQAHARFLAQSRKNLVKKRTFQLNVIWGGATAQNLKNQTVTVSMQLAK